MTPVTHRGRRRLDREQPVERLRGLLDDDLRATGHELPRDDRAEAAHDHPAAAPGPDLGASGPAELPGAADGRRRLPGSGPVPAPARSAEGTGAGAVPLDPEEQPWVSPIRARLPWATLVIAGLVLILVVVSVLLRGGEKEAMISAPASEAAVESGHADASAGAEGAGTSASEGAQGGAEGSGAALAPGGAEGASDPVTVHVVGEVGEPGVVELPAGSRVADAVEAAGGLSEAAAVDAVNMAAPAADGVQIVIPDQQLAEQWEQDPASAPGTGAQTGGGGAEEATAAAGSGAETGAGAAEDPGAAVGPGAAGVGGTIDLNTATAAELEELPKVGPVLAQRIIEHREQIGGFRSVEELDDVSGIGPAMMEAIAPQVTV